MLFYSPGIGYLPAGQVRRIAPRDDHWVIVDVDGHYHQTPSLEHAVVWSPVPAQPGWHIVNAWVDETADEGIRLERLPVVAWQVIGSTAEPIAVGQRATVWALASGDHGPLVVPADRTIADETAFIAYARERYAKVEEASRALKAKAAEQET
jgi:hypothetical protein